MIPNLVPLMSPYIRPQCRCSASSEIILPALSSGQIRQDNSGFVCLSASRPLCIEQLGENQNQNWTGQTGCAAFVTDTSVFSPLLYPGFTLFQVCVCTLRNPQCLCQRSSPNTVNWASRTLNYWERPWPLPCQLEVEEMCSSTGDRMKRTPCLPAAHTQPLTSGLDTRTPPPTNLTPDPRCTPGHMLEPPRNRLDKSKMITALILYYKTATNTQASKCF